MILMVIKLWLTKNNIDFGGQVARIYVSEASLSPKYQAKAKTKTNHYIAAQKVVGKRIDSIGLMTDNG